MPQNNTQVGNDMEKKPTCSIPSAWRTRRSHIPATARVLVLPITFSPTSRAGRETWNAQTPAQYLRSCAWGFLVLGHFVHLRSCRYRNNFNTPILSSTAHPSSRTIQPEALTQRPATTILSTPELSLVIDLCEANGLPLLHSDSTSSLSPASRP